MLQVERMKKELKQKHGDDDDKESILIYQSENQSVLIFGIYLPQVT